eukprot:m.150957 g.150957  ORF g.150957 m.150957 type:complete len:555 (+) comp16327_c0_seq3:483-2147(+)
MPEGSVHSSRQVARAKRLRRLLGVHVLATACKSLECIQQTYSSPCLKVFAHKSSFRRHHRTHDPKDAFHCPHCSYSNSRIDQWTRHVSHHHGACFICWHSECAASPPSFLSAQLLDSHLRHRHRVDPTLLIYSTQVETALRRATLLAQCHVRTPAKRSMPESERRSVDKKPKPSPRTSTMAAETSADLSGTEALQELLKTSVGALFPAQDPMLPKVDCTVAFSLGNRIVDNSDKLDNPLQSKALPPPSLDNPSWEALLSKPTAPATPEKGFVSAASDLYSAATASVASAPLETQQPMPSVGTVPGLNQLTLQDVHVQNQVLLTLLQQRSGPEDLQSLVTGLQLLLTRQAAQTARVLSARNPPLASVRLPPSPHHPAAFQAVPHQPLQSSGYSSFQDPFDPMSSWPGLDVIDKPQPSSSSYSSFLADNPFARSQPFAFNPPVPASTFAWDPCSVELPAPTLPWLQSTEPPVLRATSPQLTPLEPQLQTAATQGLYQADDVLQLSTQAELASLPSLPWDAEQLNQPPSPEEVELVQNPSAVTSVVQALLARLSKNS